MLLRNHLLKPSEQADTDQYLFNIKALRSRKAGIIVDLRIDGRWNLILDGSVYHLWDNLEGHIPRSIIGQLEGEPQDIYGGAIVHFGPEECVCGVRQPEIYLAFSCVCWKWALLVRSELAG